VTASPSAAAGGVLAGAAAGIAIGMGSQALRFALRFGYQVVIARLLLPEDFGLVAMAAVVIGLAQVFVDPGLGMATVQQKAMTRAQLDCLFWLNLAAGVLLAGLCLIAAPYAARFYAEPRLAGVVVAAAGTLLLGAVATQHLAMLTREMRFRSLAALDMASTLAGGAAGIGAALLGAGYWAILVNQGVAALATLLLAWRAGGWTPGRPRDWRAIRPLLRFGVDITGFRLVKFFSRNSDNILIGRFAGAGPLGLYDRAFRLMLLPFEQISAPFSKVALPLLARGLEEPEAYRLAWRRILETMLLLTFPGLACMIVCSRDLVLLVLGEPWAAVAPILSVLGIDGFVGPVAASLGWLFVSQGRTREMRNWGAVTSVIFIAAFAVGLAFAGVLGVACGYAAAGVIELALLWRVATRRGPVGAEFLLALLLPFLAAIPGSFGAVWALRRMLPAGLVHGPAGLALQALAAYAAFAAVLAVLPAGRAVLRAGIAPALARLRRVMAERHAGGRHAG
jgi:PST family polysaccharide transporter